MLFKNDVVPTWSAKSSGNFHSTSGSVNNRQRASPRESKAATAALEFKYSYDCQSYFLKIIKIFFFKYLQSMRFKIKYFDSLRVLMTFRTGIIK